MRRGVKNALGARQGAAFRSSVRSRDFRSEQTRDDPKRALTVPADAAGAVIVPLLRDSPFGTTAPEQRLSCPRGQMRADPKRASDATSRGGWHRHRCRGTAINPFEIVSQDQRLSCTAQGSVPEHQRPAGPIRDRRRRLRPLHGPVSPLEEGRNGRTHRRTSRSLSVRQPVRSLAGASVNAALKTRSRPDAQAVA